MLSGIESIAEGVSAGVATVLESPGWSLTDVQARDAVEALSRARAQVEAAYLHALRVLGSRPDALEGAGKGKVAVTFLIGRLYVDSSVAAADVRAARALDPDGGGLARLGAALAAGEVSREHVDVAVGAVSRLPKAVLSQRLQLVAPGGEGDVSDVSGAEYVDAWLTEQACAVQPRTLKAMARGLRDRLDPDHEDRSFDPDAHLKRSLSLQTDRLTGMATLRATVMAADVAALAAFLRSATKPAAPVETLREEADGTVQTVVVADERSVAMRRYDAVFGLLRAAFASRFPAGQAAPPASTDAAAEVSAADGATSGENGTWSGGAGVPVQLLVTATLDQVAAAAALAAGSAVPAAFAGAGRARLDRVGDLEPSLLAYLSCTAAVQRLLVGRSGEPLDVGRSARFASVTQRRAAAVRDAGCVIPYCPCPAEDVDLHHLVHWAAGGPTDLVNLASVCERHHQETHAGVWEIEVREGVVWVKPPPWVDPLQRWLRSPGRSRQEAVERAAEQLRLRFDDAA